MAFNKDIRKIVVIGPESTGKSTLTEALALHYHCDFVPEYARSYIEHLNREYVYEDLWEIAKGQLALEDEKLKQTQSGYLFCDTDLNVIKVWSLHKYNKCEPQILEIIEKRKYDFYFLTDIDLPWEPDPQREHPDPEMRAYFMEIYQKIVINSGVPWVKLSGNKEERLLKAIEELNRFSDSDF